MGSFLNENVKTDMLVIAENVTEHRATFCIKAIYIIVLLIDLVYLVEIAMQFTKVLCQEIYISCPRFLKRYFMQLIDPTAIALFLKEETFLQKKNQSRKS